MKLSISHRGTTETCEYSNLEDRVRVCRTVRTCASLRRVPRGIVLKVRMSALFPSLNPCMSGILFTHAGDAVVSPGFCYAWRAPEKTIRTLEKELCILCENRSIFPLSAFVFVIEALVTRVSLPLRFARES